MDHSYSERGGIRGAGDSCSYAFDVYFSAVGPQQACDYFQQCGFARAIFTEEKMGSAGRDGERNIVIRRQAWKCFCDSFEFKVRNHEMVEAAVT